MRRRYVDAFFATRFARARNRHAGLFESVRREVVLF
jgi:hypothetical protein